MAGLAVLLILVLLPGCFGKCDGSRGSVPTERQSGGVKAAAGDVGKAASIIDEHTKAIEKEAPAEKPHTDAIGEQTDALRDIQDRLNKAQATIKAGETESSKLKARVADLESAHNTLLKKWLAMIAIAALIGAPLAAFLLKNIPLALACGAVFCLCISAEWLIQWAEWIAMGTGALLLGSFVWFVLIQHRTVGEFVTLARRVAPMTDPAEVAKAEAGLSQYAHKIAASIEAKARNT